mmetsp:Transcript_116553/g.310060  ORF Transcript_116553/g.310060 Transcript_116553/m.310060 type:complete len:539 (-) Transcript_116553:142-1758(-)
MEVAYALGLEAPLLPDSHALLLHELRHQLLALLVLGARPLQVLHRNLILRTLLRQLSQGQRLPHCHGLQQLHELVLWQPLLLWTARALVPLDQLLHCHLLDGLVLLHKLQGSLVAAQAPHGQALCFKLELVIQALAQTLQHGLAAISLWQAVQAAFLLELAKRQTLPDEHVAEAVDKRLRVQLGVEGNAHLAVLHLQRDNAQDLQSVHLCEQLLGKLRAAKTLGGDATGLATVAPHAVHQLLVELVPRGLLAEVTDLRGVAIGLALAQQLGRGQDLPYEGLLQCRDHGVLRGARRQAQALALGHELVGAGILDAAHLREDGQAVLRLFEPGNGDTGVLPLDAREQLQELLARLVHLNLQAPLRADRLQGHEGQLLPLQHLAHLAGHLCALWDVILVDWEPELSILRLELRGCRLLHALHLVQELGHVVGLEVVQLVKVNLQALGLLFELQRELGRPLRRPLRRLPRLRLTRWSILLRCWLSRSLVVLRLVDPLCQLLAFELNEDPTFIWASTAAPLVVEAAVGELDLLDERAGGEPQV